MCKIDFSLFVILLAGNFRWLQENKFDENYVFLFFLKPLTNLKKNYDLLSAGVVSFLLKEPPFISAYLPNSVCKKNHDFTYLYLSIYKKSNNGIKTCENVKAMCNFFKVMTYCIY